MPLQKVFPVSSVTKCFGATGPRDRKRRRKIAKFQAIVDFSSTNKFVDKASIERISGAHGIDDLDRRRRSATHFPAAARQCSLRAALYHQQRHLFRNLL